MREKKEFLLYVIPSVLAFALSGEYAIVDGFFVGNSIGDAGLAAINVAYPVTALLQALGTGIGMGGAVQYSIHAGEDKREEQRAYISWTLLLLAVSSLAAVLLLFPSVSAILSAFGANGQLLEMGKEYLRVIILGAVFQIFGTGLVPLIRNMGGSVFAMCAMIAGFLTNILLDYLFVWVFGYGLGGAAAATIIGQTVTVAACVVFVLKKGPGLSLKSGIKPGRLSGNIMKVAVSPFGLTFSPNIVLILMNKFSMIYGGEGAVACYAVIAYISTIVLLLLQGVGDGSQPLVSRYYGRGRAESVRSVGRMAYISAFLLAAACIAGLYAARNLIAPVFGASAEVSKMSAEVLPFFLAGFMFIAYLRITTACCYATEKNVRAFILIYGEPAMLLAALLLLPEFMGLEGVWAAVPVSQFLTAACGVIIQRLPAS